MSLPYLPPLTPPTIVWVGLVVSGALLPIAILLTSGGWLSRKNGGARIVTVAAFLFLGSAVGLLVTSFFTFMMFYIPAFFNSPLAAVFAIGAGFGLYWLKKNRLHLYAAAEIIGAGGTLIACVFTPYGSPLARTAALVAGIYFLVRGLENAEKSELWSKLRQRLRNLERPDWLIMAVGLATMVNAILPRPEVIDPPYMANKDGSQTPVSPLDCGGFFIVCDEAAWRERDRLLRSTPADRARSEQEAGVRRQREYERRSGRPVSR